MINCLTRDERRDRRALMSVACHFGAVMLSIGLTGPSMAQQIDSVAQPDSQIDEVDVTSRKQTALDAEAISLSDTPDAEPWACARAYMSAELMLPVTPLLMIDEYAAASQHSRHLTHGEMAA